MTLGELRERAGNYFRSLQEEICTAIEDLETGSRFITDEWKRPGGGGGVSKVLENGSVFEKAGVNFSRVSGILPDRTAQQLQTTPGGFFATGISLVLHPASPMVPAVHMNLRYFELENGSRWFGGGSDLTPHYHFAEDTIHFHSVLKSACDSSDPLLYPRFKKWCDEYFLIRHRGETRGVGGIFFDYLNQSPEKDFLLVHSIGDAFLHSYIPIVRKRMTMAWGDKEREWQLVRRGRYVEFNLVYDRGTSFGLETDGRVESVLMSLPPAASWKYDHHPGSGSPEAELLQILKEPREWIR